MSLTAEIILLVWVLNLGISFGAGLYEAQIVIPLWFPKSNGSDYQVNPRAMTETDSGRKFWAFVTTGPLTLLTLANLVLAWQTPSPSHGVWLTAALIALVERIGTFSFFIPTVIKLQRATQLSTRKVGRSIAVWVGLNYVRCALTLLAWVLALDVLSNRNW